jgi:hypothetical protein
MKNLIFFVLIGIIYVLSTSCEKIFGDFLDKAPGIDVTIDTIFSSRKQVEMLLANIYEQGLPDGYPGEAYVVGTQTWGNNYNVENPFYLAGATDELEAQTSWYSCNTYYNQGSYTAGTTPSLQSRYYVTWYVIRQVNLMLENVDKVQKDMDQAYKDQVKGEVKFIRAQNYFDWLRHYGAAPIVTKPLLLTDDLKIKQSSVDSCFQFILKDLEDAIAVLPDVYPSNMTGRITKGAALMLKAKALLYAASPMFNVATPTPSYGDPSLDRLLCYGNYDVNRWKLAADAAKAVLDWAPSGGRQLVKDKGVDKNYKYVWEVPDNSEIILANQGQTGVATYKPNGGTTTSSNPWYLILPINFFSGSWGGYAVTQSFIEKFYDKRDGTPQTWSESGNDLNLKYSQLDYRFAQSVAYNGSYFNWQVPIVETFTGGKHESQCVTGAWLRKMIPENWRSQTGTYNHNIKWPLYRLADAYLWYAEALNEYNGTPPQAAYDAINTIRERSGMPNLPTGLTQSQFRDCLRKERAVEFFMEDSRWWDIRRWRAADSGVMYGPMYGLKINKVAGTNPQEYSYQRYVFETRTWSDKMYWYPHDQNEVNKGIFKQLPLW